MLSIAESWSWRAESGGGLRLVISEGDLQPAVEFDTANDLRQLAWPADAQALLEGSVQADAGHDLTLRHMTVAHVE